jgi:alkanesulfonate monooxygenase SsuD/methylene tetrahydromethanopterin reductase-like flavin-dependent oxidoreductase (luciferase family)
MSVRVGIFLNVQQPAVVSPAQIIAEACAQTRLGRDLGFDIVAAGQHFLTDPYQMLQPVPLLARVAAEAGEMRLHTGVLLLTLLNPVEVAEHAATLDAICDGRFVLGVGLGYRTPEDEAFGIDAHRVRVFRDKLDVVRRLLEGETVTASGPGYRLHEQALALLPVQRPRPPIWIAANADAAVERAARLADSWLLNPHTNVAELERQVSLFHAARAAAGRGPVEELATVKELYVGSDDGAAVREARPYLESKYRAYVQWGQDEALPAGDTIDREWDELAAGGRFVVGGPERCAAELQEQIDRLGLTTLIFRFGWPGMPDALVQASMRRAAELVFPRLSLPTPRR